MKSQLAQSHWSLPGEHPKGCSQGEEALDYVSKNHASVVISMYKIWFCNALCIVYVSVDTS